MNLFGSLKRTLERMNDNRRAPRIGRPKINAYFWNGAEPLPNRLRDISQTGAYMYTDQRWYLGTIVQVTLHAEEPANVVRRPAEHPETVSLWCKVVRHDSDGVGLQFVFSKPARKTEFTRFLSSGPGIHK